MGFRINTNIAAMASHSSALANNRNLDNSLNKLSSGLRINKAADDASGLAIANSLRAQASSLGQAINNGNDGIGLIQTADGALNEYSNILDTIKTKAVQAASDGQNSASRLAIQKDIDRLLENLNNIASTTSFNGQKLLSGTFSNKEFQVGASANQTVKASIASAETSQIGQTTQARLDIATEGISELTVVNGRTGESLSLESVDVQYNNKAANGLGEIANQLNKYSDQTGITAKAIVSVNTGAISAGATGVDFQINGVQIGKVNVADNDKDGTLLKAINGKTTETGVAATKNADGSITLSSKDGRAIEVTGSVDVTASTTQEMTTLGYIQVTQAGSSDFGITGAKYATTFAGADLNITGTMSIVQDSVLVKDSVIGVGSVLAEGTELGTLITATTGMGFVVGSSSEDMVLGKDSKILSGSILNKDTEISTDIGIDGSVALTLSSDMLLKAGTVLTSGAIFDAGTKLEQNITVAGVTYNAGNTLAADLALTSTITLIKDMKMFVDTDGTPSAALGSGTVLAAGTILGLDITVSSDTTLDANMVLKEGSVLISGSEMAKGSVLGETITITAADITLSGAMTLKIGTVLGSASELAEGSTVGGLATLGADTTLTKDMLLKEGSLLISGSTLAKGTVLTQDLTADQVNSGDGLGLKAGTVLDDDLVTTADITLTEDLTLLEDSELLGNSKIVANAEVSSNVDISGKVFSSLSEINVTTIEGAMRAMSTLDTAITDLDAIRSDLGSVQNQLVSTINNISVTQVNVKAAESGIRDVDFAAESANFSKYNILAQSGSYAMSQANAVQQNVMKLLQ